MATWMNLREIIQQVSTSIPQDLAWLPSPKHQQIIYYVVGNYDATYLRVIAVHAECAFALACLLHLCLQCILRALPHSWALPHSLPTTHPKLILLPTLHAAREIESKMAIGTISDEAAPSHRPNLGSVCCLIRAYPDAQNYAQKGMSLIQRT